MKTRKLVLSVILFGGIPFSVPALQAQEWKLVPKEEIEAEIHPKLLERADEYLRFDTCRISIGILEENDSPYTEDFRFRNVGKQAVALTKVITTCGCTVAGFSQKPLAPGEEGSIRLTFHPQNRPGTVDVDALIYTTLSESSPIARLSLAGYVNTGDEWSHLPQSMGHLRLSRKQVVFKQPERKVTERIACANSGERPVRLEALLLPSCLTFRSEPAVLAPGQEGDLVITLDTDKLDESDMAGKHFFFIVDGITGKPSERRFEIIIKN